MKRFTVLALALVIFIGFSTNAQQIQRCITEEKMQELFAKDPQAKLRYETTRKMLDERVKQYMNDPAAKMMKTTAIINIPVVVHIILPNPNLVTDAMVQKQLDTLNWYYGAAPAGDSMRVYSPFRDRYGRSQIRFCLAKRTPTNTATTGIVRVSSNEDFSINNNHPSTVASAWNTRTYLNMWVVSFGNSGTLGFSYKPGTWPPGHQNIGYVVDFRAFGAGPGTINGGYHYNSYNHGKTAVHEIGHFFNLDHTWGPNNSGNPTCTLSDGCADTPPTDGPNFGCTDFPPVLDNCSPAAPGVMWQNHMDYADDRCMLLFTNDQVARMETALNNSSDRNQLITSNGCQPLGPVGNDAAVTAIVSPAAGSMVCAASVTPVVTLNNAGSTTITSATLTASVNGTLQTPFTWIGNLAPGTSVNVTMPAISLSAGNNNLVVASSFPNGNPDANTTNDQASVSVQYATAVSLPLMQDFEAATFPPAGWFRYNPDGDATQWTRANTGRNSNGSMKIDNFATDVTNTFDEFRSSPFNTAGVTTLNISFDLAHKNFPQTGFHDTLSVLVSADCGASFQTVYKKWGSDLATAGASNQNYQTPAAGDWRTEVISVTGAVLSNPQLMVVFRNSSRFGNNIFIDNINIQQQSNRDLRLVQVNTKPVSCDPSITPSVTVLNNGGETITGFNVGYRIDNGNVIATTFNSQSLLPGASITVNLNASGNMVTGGREITAFVYNVSSVTGTGDIQTNNDTLSTVFYIAGSVEAPLVEGFTNSSFPPAGWSVINPDGAITWNWIDNGNGNTGSAYMNTFNYSQQGQQDMLVTPSVNYNEVDSVKLSFDVSAAVYAGVTTQLDSLEVLVSKDCGNTFTSIYKKAGAELQTVTLPANPPVQFYPTNPTQWRTEVLDLTGFGRSGPIMVYFRTVNNNRNNIFIDNVNIATRVLPQRIKDQGYLILPNPFTSSFNVWHVQPPADLRAINVYNAAGQLVYQRQFNGTNTNVQQVDLSNKAAGVYLVQLIYTDETKNVAERIIKL